MLEGAALHRVEGSAPPRKGRGFFFESVDGTRLRGAYWRGRGRGLATILQGRTEFIEKYYPVVERLQDLGFDVATLDWRGQGLSERLLEDPRKGYVERFGDYQRDLDALLRYVVAEEGAPSSDQAPWVMVGHSMGCAIGARTLMRQFKAKPKAAPPGQFSCAVLSAPMLRLAGGPMRRAAMRLACRVSIFAGRSRAYVPGASEQTTADLGFEDNVLTSDERRFAIYSTFLKEHPELALGGPTWGWLISAMSEMRRLRATNIPALVVIGDADLVVDSRAAQAYADATPDGRSIVLPGARHEPFIERMAVQERLWRSVTAFLDENGL